VSGGESEEDVCSLHSHIWFCHSVTQGDAVKNTNTKWSKNWFKIETN
jgi:hypothetical protein